MFVMYGRKTYVHTVDLVRFYVINTVLYVVVMKLIHLMLYHFLSNNINNPTDKAFLNGKSGNHRTQNLPEAIHFLFFDPISSSTSAHSV